MIAIIITIMVLEMKVPHGAELAALVPLWPVFVSYALSFLYVGIYWNNHHHMLHATSRVNGSVLWANLGLLFCLSLLPFTTGWMGENHFARWPTMIYGLNLLAAAVAYFILQNALIRLQGHDSTLARAIGRDVKGKISPVFYVLGMLAAWFLSPWLGLAFFVAVALLWLVPDSRIERQLRNGE